MGNWIWIILGLGLLFWMFKKRGCCGVGKEPMKEGKKETGENESKDPVCGMAVNKDAAAATSEHGGNTFYFCAQGCKDKFDAEPIKYMGKEEKGGTSCCH